MGIYSEKVMEHFNNPHNQGKPDDYDAVGEVGNPVCLLPETMVQINDDYDEIINLKEGDKVLSHDGHFNKVTRTFRNDYNGKIVTLKSRLGEVYLTPDHNVFGIKVPESQYYLRIKNKSKLMPDWFRAKDFEKGDMLAYPILKEIKDVDKIKIKINKKKFDYRSNKIPTSVKINDDFLRVAGYFISEGSSSEVTCRTHLGFTFGVHEEEYVKDVAKTIKKLFGLKAIITHRKDMNTSYVCVNSVHLTKFFRGLFGVGSENKKIPQFMMLLPPKKQESLIRGLWRGDGFLNERMDTCSECISGNLEMARGRGDDANQIYLA